MCRAFFPVGDVVFYGCGQNVTAVYRITGWDAFRRASGAVTLTPAQAGAAKSEAFKVAAVRSSAGKVSRIKNAAAPTLPRLPAPPVLDGKPDDEAWKKAGRIDDFRMTPAEEDTETVPTAVLAGYDDDALYLAVRCAESKLDQVRAVGSPMHLDDSVEIFIDRQRNRSTYYQMIVNGAGAYYVGYGWAARPDIRIATKAGREADAWIVEIAIAWKAIDAAPPKPGERLGFNVVRNHFAGGESHGNWSPLRGNLNHTPAYFGTLYVGDALPREAVALREGRAFVHRLGDAAFALDGSLDKWKTVRPLKIMDGTKPVADVYLGWRADGLYAAFDVTTDRPWKNAAAVEMAFSGGASVDLNLAPADAKDKMAAGSVRFLAAPLGGETDVVEMRVPVRAPLKLASGQRLRLEASVILATKDGTRAELRLPWHSTSGDDMFVATDVVIESTLRPANWGEAELE